MKNTVTKSIKYSAVILSLLAYSFAVNAQSGSAELIQKLDKFKTINSHAKQRIISPEGRILNESEGDIAISRPGKLYWHVTKPDEDLIVSDGKTVWFYTPMLEQVSILNYEDAIAGTPFVLLTGASKKQWADYLVTKQDGLFVVTYAGKGEAKDKFTIKFDKNDRISEFANIEATGQRSEFFFTVSPKNKKTPLFTFKIPKDIDIDDQR